MNLKTSLILAFVFLGLGMVVFYDAIKWQPERMEKAERDLLIFDLAEAKVAGIDLFVPGASREQKGDTVAVSILCRDRQGCSTSSDQAWKVLGAADVPGDAAYIGSLIGSIANVKRSSEAIQVETKTRRLQNFQIDPLTGRTIQVRFADGRDPLEIVFGSKTPVDSNYYMWTNRHPESVFVVPHYFYRAIDRDAFHWQSKSLLPGFEVSATDDRRLRWRSKNIGQWYECFAKGSVSPPTWRCKDRKYVYGSTTTMEALFKFVRELRITEIRAKDIQVERQLRKRPQLEIMLMQGKQEVSLSFFRSGLKGTWLVQSSAKSWLGVMKSKELERFAKPFKDYRRRQIISRMERDKIGRVEFTNGKKVILVLSDAPKIESILKPLSRPIVQSFHSLQSPVGQKWKSRANWKLRLLDQKNNLVRELSVWVEDSKKSFVNGESMEEIREIGADWTGKFLQLIQ